MENYLSLREVVDLKVPKFTRLPTLRKVATEQNWQSRSRKGRGGGLEYLVDSMPVEIQSAIMEKRLEKKLEQLPPLPETAKTPAKPNKKMQQLGIVPVDDALRGLDDGQKQTATARIALVSYVLAFANAPELHMGIKESVAYVVDLIATGRLPEDKQHYVSVANDRSGSKQKGVSFPTLYRWVLAYRAVPERDFNAQLLALAPRKSRKQTPLVDIAWLPDFLRFYARSNQYSVKQALKLMAHEYVNMGKTCPSYDVVTKVLERVPIQMKMRGRVTGSAFKQFLPYIERDWQALKPNDVWVGDGHSFKARVLHPKHGRPFVPEITMIVDGCSGAIMGWSVALSENAVAVADALRHCMTGKPPPLGYYSDNGSGETANMLDKEVTGILPRLGIEHMTGIPGNPQGRGRIERLWQTVTIPMARHYATYQGKDADRETVRKVSNAITSWQKAEKRGDELTPIQAAAKAAVPTWKQFQADLEEMVRWYNWEHEHSSLPINSETGKHFTPMAYYEYRVKTDGYRVPEIEQLSEQELDFLYRPEEWRFTRRGLIKLWNNSYFLMELADYHGKQVRVSYDIHDASSVIVKDADGRIIGKAKFQGNRRAAFAETRMEQLAERRLQGIKQLAQTKVEMAELERNSAIPALEHSPAHKLLDDIIAESADGKMAVLEPVATKPKAKPAQKMSLVDEDDWDWFDARKMG